MRARRAAPVVRAIPAVLAVLAFVIVLAAPTVALAASDTGTIGLGGSSTSPFSPGLPESAVPTTTSSTTTASSTASSTNSGLSGSGIAGIAAGALLLIGGISFFIWYDARRKAPIRAGADPYAIDGGRRAGSKAKPKSRKLSAAERKRRKRGRAR